MAQLYIVETEFGNINITKNTIIKMVTSAVKLFNGKVLLSTHKGKPVKIGSSGESSAVDIDFTHSGIDIRLYVVIRFGTSIAMSTDKLIEEIHRSMRKTLGEEPKSVSVVVKGTISKNIAKRNIEVTG